MTKGNLYYYFKDKEEILFVCLDYSVDILLERLREVEKADLSPLKSRQPDQGILYTSCSTNCKARASPSTCWILRRHC